MSCSLALRENRAPQGSNCEAFDFDGRIVKDGPLRLMDQQRSNSDIVTINETGEGKLRRLSDCPHCSEEAADLTIASMSLLKSDRSWCEVVIFCCNACVFSADSDRRRRVSCITALACVMRTIDFGDMPSPLERLIQGYRESLILDSVVRMLKASSAAVAPVFSGILHHRRNIPDMALFEPAIFVGNQGRSSELFAMTCQPKRPRPLKRLSVRILRWKTSTLARLVRVTFGTGSHRSSSS